MSSSFYCETGDVLLYQSCLLADHMSEPEGKKRKTKRVGAIAARGLLDPAEEALQQLKFTVEENKDMEEQTSHVEKEFKEEIKRIKHLEKELGVRKANLLKEVSSITNHNRTPRLHNTIIT
jgi:hypothetical protein